MITTLFSTSIIQSPFPNKLNSTSSFKHRTCIQRSPRFRYSLQIFSLQPLFTTTLSMPLRNLKLSLVLGMCCTQFTEDLSKLLWKSRANPPLLGPTCRPEPLQAGGCWVSWSRVPLWTRLFQWRWVFREYPVETQHRPLGYKRTASVLSLPFTAARSSSCGKWSWCLCCATPTRFNLQLYLTPCAFLIIAHFRYLPSRCWKFNLILYRPSYGDLRDCPSESIQLKDPDEFWKY